MKKNQLLNDCFACEKWTLPEQFPSRYFSTFDNDQLGKIYKHYWKEHLQFSDIAKFESGASYWRAKKILQIFVWWGGGHKLAPTMQTSVKFATLRSYIFVSFQQMTLKRGNVTNFKVLFLQSWWILPNFLMLEVEKKKRGKVY